MSDEKIVAFCGIVCTECPAFLARKNDDDELRRKTAERWSSPEFPIKAESIDCYGCFATDKKMMEFCRQCRIRNCGVEKGVENCAYCDEYPCLKLEELWKHLQLPEPKEVLDKIKKQLSL